MAPRSSACSLHREILVEENVSFCDPMFAGILDRCDQREYEAEAASRFPNSNLGHLVFCCSRGRIRSLCCRTCRRAELSWFRARIEDVPEEEVVLGSDEWCSCPGCGIRFPARTGGFWRPALKCSSCGRYEYLWLEERGVDGATDAGVIERCVGCGALYEVRGFPQNRMVGAHETCGQRIRLTARTKGLSMD